jgi:hypothetical protein
VARCNGGWIEVAWVEGMEPPILEWSRKLRKPEVPTVSQGTAAVTAEPDAKYEVEARADTSTRFSTFPESLVPAYVFHFVIKPSDFSEGD